MKRLLDCFRLCALIILLSVMVPQPVNAMDFRTSEKSVIIREDEMVVGTLFAAGNAIDVNGAVDGDIFCAGQTVSIRGSVSGDVICAAQSIRIDGTVGGNIRVAGQTIDIEGSAERNATVMGQSLTLGQESDIAGDALLMGQTVSMAGSIGKGLLSAGADVHLDGPVDGDARIMGESVRVGESGAVTGILTYESDAEADIASGAAIGQVIKQPMRKEVKEAFGKKEEKKMQQVRGKPWPVNALGSIVMFIIIGLFGVLLSKPKMEAIADTLKAHPLASLGIGFLWYIAFPIVFLILLVTLIGIPVAVIYAMLVLFVALIAKVFVALLLGSEVLTAFWKEKKGNTVLALVIGVILAELVFHLPVVGGLTAFFSTLLGTGALVKTFIVRKKPAKK